MAKLDQKPNNTGLDPELEIVSTESFFLKLKKSVRKQQNLLTSYLLKRSAEISQAVQARVLRLAWYIPSMFVVLLAVSLFISPRAALWVLLAGCLGTAAALFVCAQYIRARYLALLSRMPQINGKAPKRLEMHAVIMGVGERSAEDIAAQEMGFDMRDVSGVTFDDGLDEKSGSESDNDDSDDSDANDASDASEGTNAEVKPKETASSGSSDATSKDEKISDDSKKDAANDEDMTEDMSSFEMFEVPLLGRERVRKLMIH